MIALSAPVLLIA